jgi:hypothetical protein
MLFYRIEVLGQPGQTGFGNPGIWNGPAFRFTGIRMQVVGLQEVV